MLQRSPQPSGQPPPVPTDVIDAVMDRMVAVLALDAATLKPDTDLAGLAVDSFAFVELAIDLQEELGVRFVQEDLPRLRTPADVAALVYERQQG